MAATFDHFGDSDMNHDRPLIAPTFLQDLTAGLVVYLVALPLCLGVAMASSTPLFAGLISGVIGGLIVGILSGSHTSVSGPSPGQVAVIAAQIAYLGSFEAFLLAVVVSGIIQIIMGVARTGGISAFVPTSVIQGLLAAIGIILILKQIPHVLGHDTDPEGEMSFQQPDMENTFSEFLKIVGDIHPGAATIGIASLAILLIWGQVRALKNSGVPAALAVICFGLITSRIFQSIGGLWAINSSHLVQVPVAQNFGDFLGFLQFPDFSQILRPEIFIAGFTIAIVTSLETLLNLEAVDKLDPKKRTSPPDRELIAQGIGNIITGLIGGIPVASVIVRSTLNINAGAQTRLAAIVHGFLLLICIMLLPEYLNMVPLSCLAAILLMTGIKLASPSLFREMWAKGKYQFLPFTLTVISIVLTDLLVGIVIGLAVSLAFILYGNLKRPTKIVVEKHLGGDVMRIELANQVSFLNRASLSKTLNGLPSGTQVLLDAHNTHYIDNDVLGLIREFKDQIAPVHGVQVSLSGFQDKYQLEDEIQFVNYSTRDLQSQMTPEQVLEVLRAGNERFRTGRQLFRNLGRQMNATSLGQHPIAVVLSCIDSRTPAELIFDLGLGDIFSIRLAGNVLGHKVMGSMEYGTAVAGAKLILVVGHTKCGAVTAAVSFAGSNQNIEQATGCQHLEEVLSRVQNSMANGRSSDYDRMSPDEKSEYVDSVARENVVHVVKSIMIESRTVQNLVQSGRVAIVGAMYNITTGHIEFLPDGAYGVNLTDSALKNPA